MEEREEGAAVAELRHYEHVALLRAKRQSERLVFLPGSHEQNKVRMPHCREGAHFAFELL